MKIRDWLHAVDLTIERYQYALDNNISFTLAKQMLMPEDWYLPCPLCTYSVMTAQEGENKCENCIWMFFEGKMCEDQPYETALERLKRWREMLERAKVA